VTTVNRQQLVDGLRALGLDTSSSVIVHSSLRSFGHVDGGAATVCTALHDTCGTVLLPASSGDLTGIPAPPGLERPDNAPHRSGSWAEFDAALAAATPFDPSLPIDRELGLIPETMRRKFDAVRSAHPHFSYLAVGARAGELVASQTLADPLAPLDLLEQWGGRVLLLGVGHTANTCIHLAEQRLGRSRFWRYAKIASGVWAEFPNIPGESDAFDAIEPVLAPVTLETRIGNCRARQVAVADVVAAATRLIRADPAALLAPDPPADSRSAAAIRQRLARLEAEAPA